MSGPGKLSIKSTRLRLGKWDKIVAREDGVEMGKNGCFDIVLVKRGGSRYEAELYVKLQFFFCDGDANDPDWSGPNDHKWTQAEKNAFLRKWHNSVKNYWTVNNVGNLKDGKPLSIVISIDAQQEGFMWDHFEIDVTKIPPTPNAFRTSYVRSAVIDADVMLDSKDLTPKASGQLAAVHEFGHMIGLPDEYKKRSPHYADRSSIMHGGTIVKKRHYDRIIKWANSKI